MRLCLLSGYLGLSPEDHPCHFAQLGYIETVGGVRLTQSLLVSRITLSARDRTAECCYNQSNTPKPLRKMNMMATGTKYLSSNMMLRMPRGGKVEQLVSCW